MTVTENEREIADVIANDTSILKANVADLERKTGLSRNTIGRACKKIWSNVRVRFVFGVDDANSLERAFFAIKLTRNNREDIENSKVELGKIRGVCEILVVEGRDTDLLAKLVAPTSSAFEKVLFDIKELDIVDSADVAFRIVHECETGYSEYSISDE